MYVDRKKTTVNRLFGADFTRKNEEKGGRDTTRHSEVEDLIETREERGSSCQLGPKEPVENDDVKNCVLISLPSFSINSTEPNFSKFAPNIYFVSTFISSRNRYKTS